jgi:hypothetical protein
MNSAPVLFTLTCICSCVTLVALLSVKPKVPNVIQYCTYLICNNMLRNICDNVIVHTVSYTLHVSFIVNVYTYKYVEMMKVCPS